VQIGADDLLLIARERAIRSTAGFRRCVRCRLGLAAFRGEKARQRRSRYAYRVRTW
jgi:hypothetical protein